MLFSCEGLGGGVWGVVWPAKVWEPRFTLLEYGEKKVDAKETGKLNNACATDFNPAVTGMSLPSSLHKETPTFLHLFVCFLLRSQGCFITIYNFF